MKDFEYKNHLHEIEHVGSRLVLGDEKRLSSPLVTVIMPIYNHPEYFKKSLSAVLNQRCDFEYEVIIVDNGHPELQKENQKVVEELMTPFTWYYVNNENVGGCNNQNMGILLAKGKYITFCHDDDLFYEETLQSIVNEKQKHPNEPCAIFGTIRFIDEKDNPIHNKVEWDNPILRGREKYKVAAYDMLLRNYSNGCSSLYERERLLEIGGFNIDYIPCPDYAMNTYYVLKFGAYFMRKDTLKYRVSPQGDCSTAYRTIVEANRKIKENIYKSDYISKLFPKFFITANLRVEHFHLYERWDKESPSAYKYFFDRIINRIWIFSMLIIKRFK